MYQKQPKALNLNALSLVSFSVAHAKTQGARMGSLRFAIGGIRKAALGDVPGARRNRRGFSAEKRIPPPPPSCATEKDVAPETLEPQRF